MPTQLNRRAVMVNDIIICTLDGFKTLTITDKASCGLFQTQHEAAVALHPCRCLFEKNYYYGDSIFCVFFSEEMLQY